jgi:hypothetical protein
MTCWYLFLLVLLQAPTDASSEAAPARSVDLPGVQVEQVPLEELRQRITGSDFVPVPLRQLPELFQNDQRTAPATELLPQIREARYVARLNKTRLDQGQLEFELYPELHSSATNPLLIGQTSLQQLSISDQQGQVELGSDSSRRLFLLKRDLPEKLTGSWTSDGLISGEVVTFRLELPAATTTRFELLTTPEIIVTSVGSLVLGPESVEPAPDASPLGGDVLQKWTILPGDAARLTFSCREQQPLQPLDPMPLVSFSAGHELREDVLKSRWTIGLPAELNGRTRLTAKVPSRVRVADAMLDDKRPVPWSVTNENGQQILNLMLPEASEFATLTVYADSVLPQTESWDLPMLPFVQWFGHTDEQHGSILVPIGQVSVLLPRAIHLDEWTLVGLQERDIVTGPDQSREYQLTQFLPEASAIARTFTSEPRLTDSVVTIVEPAGRLATVRCLINVQCEGASVVELQWPVSPGWQVIAARYASNSRALFFEFPPANPDVATSPLTLHLPESLEPGASRVIEIQFRQADLADGRTVNFPLPENPGIDRSSAIVVFPPALTLSSELQRRWSAGRRTLALDEVRRTMTWLPESRLPVGGQFYAIGGLESAHLTEVDTEKSANSNSIELEHAVRIVEGQIVETSRIVLPANPPVGEILTLLMPIGSSNDMRWSLDGQPIVAKREDSDDDSQDWRRWSLKLAGRRSAIAAVLRCESRQPADQDIVATIPRPVTDLPVRGVLQLFSSDEGQLTVPGLTPAHSENSARSSADDHSTTWELPADPTIVTMTLGHNPEINLGQTIDLHMLHLIDQGLEGGLNERVLAVANVSRSAGQNTISLTLPADIHPLVLVNGHHVQLQDTTAGLAIPLPLSSVDCQVLVAWTEPTEQPDTVNSRRELPRLFLRELAIPQCTHHLLVNPLLELQAAQTEFVAVDPTDVMHILDRLIFTSRSPNRNSSLIEDAQAPSEIRSFISRWQLASTRNWQKRTLIDTGSSEVPIAVHIFQIRHRMAIAAGTALLLSAFCLFLRKRVMEYRLGIALTAIIFLGVRFLLPVSVAEAILTGTFWGLLIGPTIVTVIHWTWSPAFSRQTFMRNVAAIVSTLVAILPCAGQQSAEQPMADVVNNESQKTSADSLIPFEALPDVLLPETQLPGNDVAYVRKLILEKWQRKAAFEITKVPSAMVTKLHTDIIADSAESVELLLKLEVAAVSSDKVCQLRIPLQGSRLVECTVDGHSVLPEPDGQDAIRIPIPASALLPVRPLVKTSEENHGTTENRDAEVYFPETVVHAGPRAAFTVHQIECRLRPVTTRQASGLQFRLPALPCPVADIRVSAPENLFTGVRAQTPAGVLQWKPTDGVVQLSSLAMSEGIDMRLFQSSVEKGSPQLATVEMLTIAEVVAEQQALTCFCRFSRWNPLTPEVRYIVPQGYRLVSVNSIGNGELLWSRQDRIATILLPNAVGKEFVLSLQLKEIASSPLLQQRIPIAELIQFADCVVSPSLQLAARVNPVFSVLPIEGNQVATLGFNDAQQSWGQWLRRNDIVFTVPSGLPECIVRRAARSSLNEVRIAQNFVLHNQYIEWNCQVDIDTSVLPVFRHRLTVSSDIEITDVQATAGEANRKASWHRRGDRLIVQLKEGTTGHHILKISGRQILRPDDTQISLYSPHVQDAQILESALELTDQDGLGLVFEKLGNAVPNDRITNNDLLQPGVPVRMQILEETDSLERSDPIVLQRIRPVEPVGSVAVLRSADQAAVAVRLTQWSGSLGPLEMKFAENTEFLTEPSVLVNGRQWALIRDADTFVASQDVIRELFDQPDFTIVWSISISDSQRSEESIALAWPEISDQIQWNERVLIPLDTAQVANNAATSTQIPAWIKDSSALGFGKDLSQLNVTSVDEAFNLSDSRRQMVVPLNSGVEVQETEPIQALFAVSDSILWSNPNQSAIGQTTLMVFAARTPARCTLIIPTGTIVTELDTAEASHWGDAARERVTLELTKPLTVIQIRWMSTRAKDGFASNTLKFAAPFPADCETRRSVTVASSESELPQFLGEVRTVSPNELNATLKTELAAGLARSTTVDAAVANLTEQPPASDDLAEQLTSLREQFLQGFIDQSQSTVILGSCRPIDNSRIEIFSRKRLQWPTVVSIAAGFLAVAGAAFGQTMRTGISEQTTRIAIQLSDSQLSNSKSQTSAGDQP